MEMGEKWVSVAELEDASLDKRAVDIVVLQDNVFAQHLDSVVLVATFHLGQQNLNTHTERTPLAHR